MSSKLNVTAIVSDHFRTMRDLNASSVSLWDLTIFYGIPGTFAFYLTFTEKHVISKDAINISAAVFAIFVGLLLNLLMIIFDALKTISNELKACDPKQTSNIELKRQLLNETFANICYCILVSIVLIFLMLISKLIPTTFAMGCYFISFFLIGNFFLTMVMVLKRVHVLLGSEGNK